MATRHLTHETETAVLEVAKDFWVREVAPVTVPNACVLATRILTVALNKYGVTANATQIDAACWNAEGYRLRNDLAATRQSKTAWSVGVMSEPSRTWIANEIASGSNPFDRDFFGHLVVETEHHFIDFTAGQFDRPQHGIITGSPLIVPNHRLVETDVWWEVPITEGIYTFRDAKYPSSPRNAPDWTANYKRDAKRLVDLLRPLLG